MAIEQTLEYFKPRLDDLAILAEVLEEDQPKLVEAVIDSSFLVRKFAEWDVASLIRILSEYDSLIRKIHEKDNIDLSEREKVGKVAIELPYNGPAMCFGLTFAGAYLFGNDVEIKFASESSPFAQTLERIMKADERTERLLHNPDKSDIFSEIRGRDFMQNHLQADSGTDMVVIYGHDRYITPKIEEMIATNPNVGLILEGPGKNRFIVTEDLPKELYDACAKAIVDLATINSGQVCMGAEIFDIHESVLPNLLPLIKQYAEQKIVGDPYLSDSDVGPIRDRIAGSVIRQIQDAKKKGADFEYFTPKVRKAEFLPEGWQENGIAAFPKYDDSNYRYVPVVVMTGVTEDMLVRKEETFGPLIPIKPFSDEAELYASIEQQRYGLGVSVWGRDLDTKHKQLVEQLERIHGHVFKNQYMFGDKPGQFDILLTPWGGYRNSRFLLRALPEGDIQGTQKLRIGPRYPCIDLSRPKSG